jgi:AAA family ATPase
VLTQLLTEIDGVENLTDVTIVAATNRPDMIDTALMRPGRLDSLVYVKLPEENTREKIFEIKKKNMPFSDDVDIKELARLTDKYSGAEITALCNEAALLAIDNDTIGISKNNFNTALKYVLPRISQETIDYFDNFHSSIGSIINKD